MTELESLLLPVPPARFFEFTPTAKLFSTEFSGSFGAGKSYPPTAKLESLRRNQPEESSENSPSPIPPRLEEEGDDAADGEVPSSDTKGL